VLAPFPKTTCQHEKREKCEAGGASYLAAGEVTGTAAACVLAGAQPCLRRLLWIAFLLDLFVLVPGTFTEMKGACRLQSSIFSLLKCVIHGTWEARKITLSA
jgi:hypothetical protein